MRRAERLFRLVNEMRTRDICRASDLAQKFEVSIATIYRDIAHLQASGLPIEGEAGIGYLLRPGFDLPNTAFTHDQIDALAIGLSFVERTGDPTLATAAREVRAKLQAGMPAPEERRLADAPYFNLQDRSTTSSDVQLLREAIRNRQIIEFSYLNAEKIPSKRRVYPLVMWNLAEGVMFSAWCTLRKDFRTFRLDRMSALAFTDEHFEDDPETGLSAFLAQDDCE